jgi:phosphoglycerate kinase
LNKLTVKDIDVNGKKVLMRVDYNVPLDPADNSIMDDSRMRATFPTIKYLVEHGARTILLTHLGRPDGKVVESMRMERVALRLSQLIALPVINAKDCIGDEVKKQVMAMKSGDILMLENVRFHPEEEANDAVFAKKLAELADIYVDDAFGTAHRAHASTVGITRFLPAYCGLLMEKELNSLGNILTAPEHPFTALLGGAKVSDKMGVIKNILDKVNLFLIGGSMASNFLWVKGFGVGLSRIESEKKDIIKGIMDACERAKVPLTLPVDVVVTRDIKGKDNADIVDSGKIPADQYIVDIGPKTIEMYIKKLQESKTVFWNGPMGIYEISKFSQGTVTMAKTIAGLKATTVVGGGSTAEIVEDMKLTDYMTHVSTGGGASLEFLEGKVLPGVAVLLDKK